MKVCAPLPFKKGEYVIAHERYGNQWLLVTQTRAFMINLDTHEVSEVIQCT